VREVNKENKLEDDKYGGTPEGKVTVVNKASIRDEEKQHSNSK